MLRFSAFCAPNEQKIGEFLTWPKVISPPKFPPNLSIESWEMQHLKGKKCQPQLQFRTLMMTDERLEIHVEQNMWHRHGSWGEINCGCKLVTKQRKGRRWETYWVGDLLWDLGLGRVDFWFTIICPILCWQMRIWENLDGHSTQKGGSSKSKSTQLQRRCPSL